jgi:hypothetical protein
MKKKKKTTTMKKMMMTIPRWPSKNPQIHLV